MFFEISHLQTNRIVTEVPLFKIDDAIQQTLRITPFPMFWGGKRNSSSNNFFVIGWEHIVDINAYDHLLFVMTLCAAYRIIQWRQIVIIITAFTVAQRDTHLERARNDPNEPRHCGCPDSFTIMLTAILNVARPDEEAEGKDTKLKYGVALGFGLVHGLAFASNFKVILFEDNIILPLLLFNLGIEVGQIFIVVLFMGGLWLYSGIGRGALSGISSCPVPDSGLLRFHYRGAQPTSTSGGRTAVLVTGVSTRCLSDCIVTEVYLRWPRKERLSNPGYLSSASMISRGPRTASPIQRPPSRPRGMSASSRARMRS